MNRFSIIIATRNRPADLRECLSSLSSQEQKADQIIIIDQSDEKYRVEVRELCKNISAEYYFLDYPKSLTHSRNLGIERASGDFVLFLDDDVVLEADYLKNMGLFFSSHPDAVGATGMITNLYAVPLWYSAVKAAYKFVRWIFLLDTLDFSGYEITPVFENSSSVFPPKKEKKVRLLSGSNMCIRAAVAKKEKFEHRFVKYSYKEDVDISFRASLNGELWFLAGCRLIHKVSEAGRLPDKERERMLEVNSYYLFCKNMKPGFFGRLLYAYSRIGKLLVRYIPLAIIRPAIPVEYLTTIYYVFRNRKEIEKGETADFFKR